MRCRLLILILFLLVSCQRLDDNLFNPNSEADIDAYLLDNYAGEIDFCLAPEYNLPSEKVHLFTISSTGGGNETLYAIYIGDTGQIDQDTVIMYCHGNKDHMDFYWQRAKLLAHVGGKNRFGVMMIDYRGYGLSEGEPSEEGLYEDVDAAYLWLKEHGLSSDRLINYGFSLGSAPATELIARPRTLQPSKLILEAPFASAEVMVQDASTLALPGSFFVNLKVDNAEEIKRIQEPFLWLHGTEDHFLSIETHGELVFENYKGSSSTPYRVEGAHHDDLPKVMGFDTYLKALQEFIEQ